MFSEGFQRDTFAMLFQGNIGNNDFLCFIDFFQEHGDSFFFAIAQYKTYPGQMAYLLGRNLGIAAGNYDSCRGVLPSRTAYEPA